MLLTTQTTKKAVYERFLRSTRSYYNYKPITLKLTFNKMNGAYKRILSRCPIFPVDLRYPIPVVFSRKLFRSCALMFDYRGYGVK